MSLITIGEFAARTRLSAKALRLYDRLGLLAPADVDTSSGYRYYSEDQVADAVLVGLLRRAGMPLDAIAAVLGTSPDARSNLVRTYWGGVDRSTEERRALISYICVLDVWANATDRQPAATFRQVMFADQRTAAADDLVCDLSVPLR